MTMAQTLARAQQIVEDTNPVDRRSPLERFVFTYTTDHPDDPNSTHTGYLMPLRDEREPTTADAMRLPAQLRLSDLALKQLLQRVGYPTKLFEKLPKGLVEGSVNWIIQHHLEDRMALLRLASAETGPYARAVLGSRYTPLDDHLLFQIVADEVGAEAEVVVESFGEVSTVITVLLPTTTTIDVDQGVANPLASLRHRDELQQGVVIANSELGMRSITIEAVAWRRTCSNILPALGMGDDDALGVTRSGDYAMRVPGQSGAHNFRGGRIGTRGAGWRFIHSGGDPNRLADFVRDAIQDSGMQYEGLIQRWQDGLLAIVENPILAIEDIAKAGQLTQAQLRQSLDAWAVMRPEFGPSATGIANTFTLAAQRQDSPDVRYRMESVGSFALRALTQN